MRVTPSRAAAPRGRRRRFGATMAAGVALVTAAPFALVAGAGSVAAAPVGQGFNLNASDLGFILDQITIAENHVAGTTSETGPCGALLGPGDGRIPDNGVGVTLPWGLRTVDGTCNNIEVDQAAFGSADRTFPRLVPKKLRAAETGDYDGPDGPAPVADTTYSQTRGVVIDSQPRTISNLVVDQTAANPAAVAAAGEAPEVDARTGSYFIPNVATDTGLSAPYNSWFTLFGQFFDHGLDLVNKGGNGSVFMPLKPDDPKYRPGSPTNFMILTRASHSGNHEAVNQTSPWIDQSQTYTSAPSHQVFLREYEATGTGPQATGKLITSPSAAPDVPGEGMATWDVVQDQAATLLGIELSDRDALSVPRLATDPYGRFLRGANGHPQLVLEGGGMREGNPASPVSTAGAAKSGHAFLDDIAHHATPGTYDPDNDPATRDVVPQVPDTDPGTGDDNDATTYDDEMLGAHFIAGDGRVNENIGLVTVHHVFHSEHNRLVTDIDRMIASEVPAEERDKWHATGPSGWDYEERLFQAARFVTEMEYQHLAFEEFARKVQPMVNLFGEGGTGYHSELDPAIRAEFAHAVYRFGHSMLTEQVDRIAPDGVTHDDIDLLDAFLNPPAFLQGYESHDAAAGAVVRGMTKQVGNELDEFVTDALRNDLLGLPLDLATLNMARARDTGVPTLNEARRAFFAKTSDTGLQPYESWADLSHSLKHPESLVNFIAAYGTADSVKGATTTAGKRAAAQAVLDAATSPDPAVSVPAQDFLNSTGPWANAAGGVTRTGVDDVDLWVGGLAEKQMVFGGLLGPTFNYVFEHQMEDLQDGDRFYYLSRTAGLNLLTQLEGNSFAELIQRNTDVASLPADSFSRPDLVFDLTKQNATGAIVDDPDTVDDDERTLLTREPNNTIRYAGDKHVVFNGSARDDWTRSSEGDDTVRGNDGNDRMEGGDGADNLIGGLGDDMLTDLFGDDTLKGGDGNDALSSGRGFGGDLNQGGRGKDFIVGGNDMTETFAGPGDDFVFAGDAEDTVFGDDGDDWIEGGKGPFNLLQGDNGAPFQDDPNAPGHDVLFSYGGEQDFDAEGGDDVMLVGPGIQRSEGMRGFDWTSHKNDPQAGNSDMRITGLLPPSVETNRDRFDLVEAMSGWNLADVLRGDDRVAADMADHGLDADGIARVTGLAGLLPADATAFTGGNILIGGANGDVVEGRGGDDLVDGDAWLDVQLEVRTGAAPFRRVDSMSALQAEVFAGTLNPADIHIVRTVRPTAPGTAADIAVFSGPRADYDFTVEGDVLKVTHARGTQADGVDRLRNVELLRFGGFTDAPAPVTATRTTDVTVASIVQNVAPTGAVTLSSTTPAQGQALTAGTAAIADADGMGTVVVTWQRATAAAPDTWVDIAGATGPAYSPTAADVGVRLRAVATYTDGKGNIERVVSAPTAAVVAVALTAPAAPTIAPATAGNASATVTWTRPVDNGGSPITAFRVQRITGGNATGGGIVVAATTDPAVVPGSATSAVVTGLANGTDYRFTVTAVNEVGVSVASARSNVVRPLASITPPGGSDTTAPTVTSTSPANNARNVNRTRSITATFSEAVDGVSDATFTLRTGGVTGPLVPTGAVVTYNPATRVATLNQNVDLARNTQYTATLTGGIRDVAGNALLQRSWTFRTN